MNSKHGVKVTKPVGIFQKPIVINYKELLKGLTKAVNHAAFGKWEEIANDALEAFSALSISTEPEELAFLLINRSVTRASFDLIGESSCRQLIHSKENKFEISEKLVDKLNNLAQDEEYYLDSSFLDRPSEIDIVKELETVLQVWLGEFGLDKSYTTALVNRLPSYFSYAVNQEWRRNAKIYRPLVDALNTPFTRASEREWAWAAYSSLLERRINESIFEESFSLYQIYVPLNAYFLEETDRSSREEETLSRPESQRVVVSLLDELEQWLEEPNPRNMIRVISGGPGSGKSSFARIFAAYVSKKAKLKSIFVPLHLIDPTKDLVDEIGRFVNAEGILTQNPLDSESPEPNLLIIFDGLDELASQGKAAAETARFFIHEVERTVEKRNLGRLKLRVLISGRELIVQENESEFRRPGQILTLLPYYITPDVRRSEMYRDPKGLLAEDLRERWWKNYGSLTGKNYSGLPEELSRDDLADVTSQPLLNYLVALSYTRGKLDFNKDINLNSIYQDLVAAVYERGYEKHRLFSPIRHMNLRDFERVLEEIGLAAWHGDGRTTTVREIEEHCKSSGVGQLLETFQEGAKTGVTRLLAAFFFRQYGHRSNGEPTFVFTHKSFGEYLAARRIVRSIEKTVRELERRRNDPDEGWDEREALRYWAVICGPSAITPYLYQFLVRDIKLRNKKDITQYQEHLSRLFSYVLQFSMPMELLPVSNFKEVMFQSRNAEEALLVALNASAMVTNKRCKIDQPVPTAFGEWFKRIQGQRTGPEPVLAATCLSYLKIPFSVLHIGDFYHADFENSDLTRLHSSYGCFIFAYFKNANLNKARLHNSSFVDANFVNAHLVDSILTVTNMTRADLSGANFTRADLSGANLTEANLTGANLTKANLTGANLTEANLTGANLTKANLTGANLKRTVLTRATLTGVDLTEAKLSETILETVVMGKHD